MKPLARGGSKEYAAVAVPALPDNITAGGIRPGASNFLARYMPGEFIVHVTGHELTGSSAVYDYIDAYRALAIIGATVLHGFPAVYTNDEWSDLGRHPEAIAIEFV